MKLKPCPLCQNETFGVEHKKVFMELTLEMGDLVAIHCYNCLASITRPTKEKAVEAWNHRPLEDQLKAHAVEVLAKPLAYIDSIVHPCHDFADYADFILDWNTYHNEEFKNKYRAEARASLGWDNDNNENNDKEK